MRVTAIGYDRKVSESMFDCLVLRVKDKKDRKSKKDKKKQIINFLDNKSVTI